jgi:hypothetical protein
MLSDREETAHENFQTQLCDSSIRHYYLFPEYTRLLLLQYLSSPPIQHLALARSHKTRYEVGYQPAEQSRPASERHTSSRTKGERACMLCMLCMLSV